MHNTPFDAWEQNSVRLALNLATHVMLRPNSDPNEAEFAAEMGLYLSFLMCKHASGFGYDLASIVPEA